jgi:hypothetical protein
VEHISQKTSNHVASQSSSSNQKQSRHTSTASTTVSKVTHKQPKKGVIPSDNASNTHQPEDAKNVIDMSQGSNKENSKVSELKKAKAHETSYSMMSPHLPEINKHWMEFRQIL